MTRYAMTVDERLCVTCNAFTRRLEPGLPVGPALIAPIARFPGRSRRAYPLRSACGHSRLFASLCCRTKMATFHTIAAAAAFLLGISGFAPHSIDA